MTAPDSAPARLTAPDTAAVLAALGSDPVTHPVSAVRGPLTMRRYRHRA